MQVLLENNIKNTMMVYGLDCWFKLRLSLANVILIQFPSFAFILWRIWMGEEPDQVSIGMFMLLTTNLTEDVVKLMSLFSDTESNLISVERCLFFNKIPFEKGYIDAPKTEDKYIIPPKGLDPSTLCLPFDESIVKEGDITFEHVTARYGEDSEPVLKDLHFTVKPGEKIGIVGRTGAGKSSLIKLFWLSLRPSSGRILIDGTDIECVDLKKFRNEVMVVSQDAALFQGNLRENIDPTVGKDKDPELRSALEKLGFKHKSLERQGLDAQVDANGDNFSQGEKQVICFSRTLVNKRKLIILDEATANIDLKTEQNIQEVQNKEFADSTMFIIAHRINTVLKCDRIMVLKFGEIIEFDSPQNLLKNENSYFKDIHDKMVEQDNAM